MPTVMPAVSPAGAPNQIWRWRGQDIRYQALGEANVDGPTVVLCHGLFVNSDHWRRNLGPLAAAGLRVFAIDLLGSGWSSKPAATAEASRSISGERGRALGAPRARLGTADGGSREAAVELAHPLGSVYNFYTWAEQLADFTREVARADRASIVANSIGCIASLQAAIDCPALFDGVLMVCPNFRELHVAESPALLRPVTAAVQAGLRRFGQSLFDAVAQPDTVKAILRTPYYDDALVTDELVSALLPPLLTPGASDVVFDTLSYSAGPLPEAQLQDARLEHTAVWVIQGSEDPWTPARRVAALSRLRPVQKVITLDAVGHCPHDEAPDQVNPLIVEFARACACARDE